MFKKLVSNLPFSPSLIGQLGFYAQRLKKEQAIRRLGLIFTVFALIIQSLAVFNPPESANASSSNNILNVCADPKISKENPICQAHKSAINNTQGDIDATTTIANGGDAITYVISIVNNGYIDEISVEDVLDDVLEYADLTDDGGGIFDKNTKVLSWKSIPLKLGESTTRKFTVTVKNPVPAMAQGQNNASSYDCVMTNTVGDTVSIQINCPTSKIIERIVERLPDIGVGENIIFGGTITVIVVFFYVRSRQLSKEIRLIRKEFNAGTL